MRLRKGPARVGAVLALLLAAADADADDGDTKPAMTVGAATQVPAFVGVEGTLELRPSRILLQADVGYMPKTYSDAIIDVLEQFHAIDGPEDALLKTAIQSSFVMRLAAGWRPFASRGFEVLAGYMLVTAGGGVTTSGVVNTFLASKGAPIQAPPGPGFDVPLQTTLHTIELTFAWRFLLLDGHLAIVPSLSYLQCVASSTSVTLDAVDPIQRTALSGANGAIQGYLDPYYRTYVKIPVVGLTMAYGF
jgi:hypothetical protein